MVKKNKLNIILSSIIILLPILIWLFMWEYLPEEMAIYWGITGNVKGLAGKVFAVFGVPFIFLITHFICLGFILFDKKQKEQNPKVLKMVFWIIPFISIFINAIMYCVAFGKVFNFSSIIFILLGIMFIVIGKYLPDIKQNKTIGIRVYWTLNNEENWEKTHKFSGKVWVFGGSVILFSAFMPFKIMTIVSVVTIFLLVFIPIIYSYYIYRGHKKAGVTYFKENKSRREKIISKISTTIAIIILIIATILMFSGEIKIDCGDEFINIEASYWEDLKVEYSKIEKVEYRKDLDLGVRTSGFGSAKLLMGSFQNEEFGRYTLYAYGRAKEFIVLEIGGEKLVIGGKSTEDTQKIYEKILEETLNKIKG